MGHYLGHHPGWENGSLWFKNPGASGDIFLYPLGPGKRYASQNLERTYREVEAVAITPDGKMALSGSMDKTCILWDLESGMPRKTLKGHISFVETVAITPDGKMALSGSLDNTCILWELESGMPLKTLKGHTHSVNSRGHHP